MKGILYFEGEVPPLNSKVLIVISRNFVPAGIWEGQLIQVHETIMEAFGEPALPNTKYVHCKAIVTDPCIPPQTAALLQGQEPDGTYSVYVTTIGTRHLHRDLKLAQGQHRALKERTEHEHELLQTILGQDKFDRLSQLLDEFLNRLGK